MERIKALLYVCSILISTMIATAVLCQTAESDANADIRIFAVESARKPIAPTVITRKPTPSKPAVKPLTDAQIRAQFTALKRASLTLESQLATTRAQLEAITGHLSSFSANALEHQTAAIANEVSLQNLRVSNLEQDVGLISTKLGDIEATLNKIVQEFD